ncbi:hypothetical protein GQ54DRAFT_95257 [Martensiomyces pterosporus]|nr:hypothetical protein GQ54DRAFT_95257 [Martensiomyces pterosporus]
MERRRNGGLAGSVNRHGSEGAGIAIAYIPSPCCHPWTSMTTQMCSARTNAATDTSRHSRMKREERLAGIELRRVLLSFRCLQHHVCAGWIAVLMQDSRNQLSQGGEIALSTHVYSVHTEHWVSAFLPLSRSLSALAIPSSSVFEKKHTPASLRRCLAPLALSPPAFIECMNRIGALPKEKRKRDDLYLYFSGGLSKESSPSSPPNQLCAGLGSREAT